MLISYIKLHRKAEKFNGAFLHDPVAVIAAVRPGLFKWKRRRVNVVTGNLPEKGSTYTIAEDHVDPDLLFVGTQFGVYFTNNGGVEWLPLKSGMPNASVMDMEIQRRENDLVVSTFGRGIYILDDYTPLRHLSKETLKKDVVIFPVKDALMFIPSTPFGFNEIGFMGASFYSAPNPDRKSVV